MKPFPGMQKRRFPKWKSTLAWTESTEQPVSGLYFGQRLDAGSAQSLGNKSSVVQYPNLLDIDIPSAASCFLGPRPVVAKLGAPSTILTLSHYDTPFRLAISIE
jgi:hypothetical protein